MCIVRVLDSVETISRQGKTSSHRLSRMRLPFLSQIPRLLRTVLVFIRTVLLRRCLQRPQAQSVDSQRSFFVFFPLSYEPQRLSLGMIPLCCRPVRYSPRPLARFAGRHTASALGQVGQAREPTRVDQEGFFSKANVTG